MLAMVPHLAALVFVVAVLLRALRIARMPVHLRWELYPMPSESQHAAAPITRDGTGRPWLRAARFMVPEILLLAGVRAHNPGLWRRSYPFHLGLYLLATFLVLLLAGAGAELGGVRFDASPTMGSRSFAGATVATLVVGLGLLGTGAASLLVRRVRDPVLRAHSAAGDYVNLAGFVAMAGLGLAAWGLADRDCVIVRRFVIAVLTFQSAPAVPTLVAAEIALGSALVAYIPLTHMSHFFTKWFLYHDVRWNDEANHRGSRLEAAIARQLGFRVGWRAPHIGADGKKTWAEVASEEGRAP
jgi:nitrate reductase gamma subunit